MRKKSHILLGRYLADQMSEVYSLQQHRKAFCLGNIMPDLRPSFLTTRHEFFGTFNQLQNKMKELVERNPEEENCDARPAGYRPASLAGTDKSG